MVQQPQLQHLLHLQHNHRLLHLLHLEHNHRLLVSLTRDKLPKKAQNPALKATMDISRLQRDQQNALTSDQKAKLKPILQELISTTNPSQDILQQKADAINAVFTDQQKTFLATPRTPMEISRTQITQMEPQPMEIDPKQELVANRLGAHQNLRICISGY